MKENPYQLADDTADILNRKAIERFRKAKKKMQIAGFDELSIIKICRLLYQELEKDNYQAFLDLAILAYLDAEPHGNERPDESWIFAMLDDYNPVTLYVYEHEVKRKQQRAEEAINSTDKKKKALDDALRYWSQMTTQYTIDISDQATIKAFKDAGVKEVVWHTEEDSRVCPICKSRNGKTYPITKIPIKPHWGCRCWISEK